MRNEPMRYEPGRRASVFVLSALSVLAALVALTATRPADAFCGFYISRTDAKRFNNATQVILMRDGTRTILSMQNNYQGPPDKFAMIVPVPVVLQKENVKTLASGIFDKVDRLAAPRLVEYWERDPCGPDITYAPIGMAFATKSPTTAARGSGGIKIEAQFKVGEYEIVILSATDSAGLDAWLRQEKYQIPKGAAPLLRPYVQAGSKFFVAKVDPKKVKFSNGMATLSPLRFHYDSDAFRLPIRLGLINANGKQDLIVHILAKGQRYALANRKNVTIPTNIDVKDEVRTRFGEFYAALFDRTLEQNPGAAITEYAWDASTCDPCPSPALNANELATLGADVLTKAGERRPWPRVGFVLTRLHMRYGKGDVQDDLIFREAAAIAGGREVRTTETKLEQGTSTSSVNNFQGRYAIRHSWTGPINCEKPIRNRWGAPPTDARPSPIPAVKLAFAPRGKSPLRSFVASDIPELNLNLAVGPNATNNTVANTTPPTDPSSKQRQGRGCAAGRSATVGMLALFASILLVTRWRLSARKAAT